MDSREKSAVDEAAETAFVLVQNLTRPFTTTQVKSAADKAAETAFVLVQNLTRPFTTTQVSHVSSCN